MTLNQLLGKIDFPYSVPECLLYLEVRFAKDVCLMPLKAYLRDSGEKVLKDLMEDFDEYSYAHETPYIWIYRSGASYCLALASDEGFDDFD